MGRERGAIWTRAGKDIVLIWIVTASIDHSTLLVQCGLFIDVVIAMQVFHVPSDQFAFRIKPGALTDTIACMYRGRVIFRVFPVDSSGGTQIGTPGLVTSIHIIGKILTMLIGTFYATELAPSPAPMLVMKKLIGPVILSSVTVVACDLSQALTITSMVEARMILFTVTSRKIVNGYHSKINPHN